MALGDLYIEDCVGPTMGCHCTRCAVQQEHDADAYELWRREELGGATDWWSWFPRFAGETTGGPPRPASPVGGFTQLGDDADGEGWD